jgi:hypothetical protein
MLDDAVFLRAPVSRSRPPCLGRSLRASHAIGFAEPRHDDRSPGISAPAWKTGENQGQDPLLVETATPNQLPVNVLG